MGVESVPVPGSATATPERKKKQQPSADNLATTGAGKKKTPSSPNAVIKPSSPKPGIKPSSPKAFVKPSSPKSVIKPSSPNGAIKSSSPNGVNKPSSPNASIKPSSPSAATKPSSPNAATKPSSPNAATKRSSPNAATKSSSPNGEIRPVSPNAAINSSSAAVPPSPPTGLSADASSLPAPTTAPTSPTPAPTSPTPAPASPTPASASPTPAPASPTPAPASPTPAPTSPTPAPASPIPAPASPTPAPASPAPAVIRTPSPTVSRKKIGRRTSFKKSASFRARKESETGATGAVPASAVGGGGKKDPNGKSKFSKKKKNSSGGSSSEEDEGRLKQGPWFLKLAKTYHAQGDNPVKAFQFASRAIQCFEKSAAGKSSLDLVVSLHILAALQCRLGHFEEAVSLLERALSIPDLEGGGIEHTLATFAGRMQLGDTLALQGKHQLALSSYQVALQLQKQSLGELDMRVAETCRYVAEAHLQAMQFDEAGELCELALKIHEEKSTPGSVEEAADRRLMAMVCSGKGNHEAALEHLVLSSTVLLANGLESDVAAVDATIGDTLYALGRDTEAALSYQKALTVFKSTKGEGHALVASVLVRLAELYWKTGKPREAKAYCESALRICGTQGAGHALEDIVYGLTDIAGIYELMGEREQAISLLSRAVDIQASAAGQVFTAAGVEAQLGILYFMVGKFPEAFTALTNSVEKLKTAGDGKKTLFLGMLLNQLGLTAVELCEIEEATGILEESRRVLDEAVGPLHEHTLTVCSNLAGTYDAQGRTYEAISLLETVLDVKEDKFGSVHPEVENERLRLAQLLQEVGRTRTRKTNTLEELLSMAKQETGRP